MSAWSFLVSPFVPYRGCGPSFSFISRNDNKSSLIKDKRGRRKMTLCLIASATSVRMIALLQARARVLSSSSLRFNVLYSLDKNAWKKRAKELDCCCDNPLDHKHFILTSMHRLLFNLHREGKREKNEKRNRVIKLLGFQS